MSGQFHDLPRSDANGGAKGQNQAFRIISEPSAEALVRLASRKCRISLTPTRLGTQTHQMGTTKDRLAIEPVLEA